MISTESVVPTIYRLQSESQDLDQVRSDHGTKLSLSKASRIKQIERKSKNTTSVVAPSLKTFYQKKVSTFTVFIIFLLFCFLKKIKAK